MSRELLSDAASSVNRSNSDLAEEQRASQSQPENLSTASMATASNVVPMATASDAVPAAAEMSLIDDHINIEPTSVSNSPRLDRENTNNVSIVQP